MNTALLYFVVMLALAGLFFLTQRALKVYLRYRGKGIVVCPETRMPVAIEVDARHAAWSVAGGTFDLRLKDCSRWPERASCGQQCARQIEGAPELYLLSAMKKSWYEGSSCVFCGQPFGKINSREHKPALLILGGKTVEWDELPPEELHEALTTHLPVCWNCHLEGTSHHEHPELATGTHSKTGIHV